MKKIISTCIALMVSAACSISAFAMEVPTNTTIQDLNGVRQYIKIYTVALDTDPQSLIDDVFEYDGYTYTYSSMTKEEQSYSEKEHHTETVTADTEKSDLSVVLKALSPSIEYDDGEFRGTLYLDHSTISTVSNYARLHDGRLPVLTNFCLEEYLNIGYMEGISDVFNSIRGFNMSVQVAVQSLSQWKEKYPGMEWENQLGSFDMTLYMGCNDMTSAEYFAKKCGKVTISVTNNQFPLAPLFSPVYSTTRPYSQTRSNTQRDLLQPDEFLRLDKFKCIVMFNHYKPAELYKIMLEELPAYKELVKCSVFDYVPEWKRREDENKKRTPQKTASVPHETSAGHSPQAAAHFVPQENTSEKKQAPDREKACTRKSHAVAMPRQKSGEQCIYDFSDMKEGTSPEDIGLVEMTRSAVIGEDESDLEELDDPSRIPPGRGI